MSVVDLLQGFYDGPPQTVEIDGQLMLITDPEGQHDFAVNYSYGQVATLEGHTIAQVVNQARQGDGQIMIELTVIAPDAMIPVDLPEEPMSVVFDYPEFNDYFGQLRWTVEHHEDNEYGLTALYRV